MPLYEYECEACHHRFERIQKYSDPLIDVCPTCGGVVKKLFSSPAIQFKGSGFYITDYAKKSSPDADSSKSSRSNSSSDSSDSSASSSSSSTATTSPATTTSDSSKSDSGKSKTESGRKD